MVKLYIFGTGKKAVEIYKNFNMLKIEIEAFVDNDSSKWEESFFGYSILSPAKLLSVVDEYIVFIAIVDYMPIKTQLISMGISNECILLEHNFWLNNKLNIFKFDRKRELCNRSTIIFDCGNGLGLGGVETWVFKISGELHSRNYSNIALYTNNTKEKAPGILNDYVTHFETMHIGSNYIILFQMIEETLKKLPCIIISCFLDSILDMGVVLKKYFPKDVKLVMAIHSYSYVFHDRFDEVSNLVDSFICVSKDIEYFLIKKGIDLKKIHHLVGPVDCEKNLLRKYQTYNKKINIAYGGRLEVIDKRADYLIELTDYLEELNIDYKLNIAGEGSFKSNIQEFIDLNNLSKKINLLGFIKHKLMIQFWQQNDIYINLSDIEGNCLSMMEAMANGCIPIVTKTSGTNESITDNYNGYILEKGDIRGIAEKIKFISENRELLKLFGDRSHKKIYNKANISITTANFIHILES